MEDMKDIIVTSGLIAYVIVGMYGCWRYKRPEVSAAKWFWGGSTGWFFSPDEYFVPEHRNWARWVFLGFLPAMLVVSGLAEMLA